MKKLDILASVLLIVGGLNWGLVAIARFDLVATVFGLDFGQTNPATRLIYGLVGLSAVYLKTAQSEELIDLVKRAGEGEIVLESSVPAVPTQGNGAGPVPHGPSPRLTPREGQILRLLAEGRGTAQLARELAISPLTVQSHVKSILEKLGVHSKIEAVTLAFRTGMVGLPGVRATTGQAK